MIDGEIGSVFSPGKEVGFYHVAAPTLEDVLRLANAVAKSVADEVAGPEGNSRA